MSNKTLVLVIIAILVVAGGLGGYFYWQNTKPLVMPTPDPVDISQAPPSLLDNNTASSTPPAATSTPVATTPGQCVSDFSQSKLTSNANMNIANRQVQINVKDFGVITVQLYDKDAPLATENFLRLTDSGYYDCLTFHRVAQGFVIQGGDPSGNGSGGQSAFGKPFKDELNPDTASYKTGYVAGVLAMANSGPNTNGSQFFITLADVNSALTHNYTIFGKVIAGMDVVTKIGQVAINPVMGATDGSPKTPVVMESVKIIK
jgi:cyclophilin family peptidyl-prolyl cis-trans isomerase